MWKFAELGELYQICGILLGTWKGKLVVLKDKRGGINKVVSRKNV